MKAFLVVIFFMFFNMVLLNLGRSAAKTLIASSIKTCSSLKLNVVSQLFDKILVAVDGSEPAYRALDVAVDLADRYSAEMVIVSVVTPLIYPLIRFTSTDFPTPVPAIIPAAAAGEYIKELRTQHEKVLEDALKRAKETKPDLKVSTKILEGRPADEIVRFAKEERFDIIVMGSKGLGGIKEIFLGSVSDRVADEASCPILIVK